MKFSKFTLFALMSFGQVSFGSYTTCSSSEMYFSDVRHDFGTAPRPGMETGTTVIVFNGDVLVKKSRIAGLGQYSIDPYHVNFEGDSEKLESTGNQISGSFTYKTTMILYKVDSVNPSQNEEVARQSVVCVKTWAMVP